MQRSFFERTGFSIGKHMCDHLVTIHYYFQSSLLPSSFLPSPFLFPLHSTFSDCTLSSSLPPALPALPLITNDIAPTSSASSTFKSDKSSSLHSHLMKQDEVFEKFDEDSDSSDEENILDVEKFTATEHYTPGTN